MPSHKNVCYDDFLAALQQYSNCQQRLGQWYTGEHQVLQTQKVSVNDWMEFWNPTICGPCRLLPSATLTSSPLSVLELSDTKIYCIILKGLSYFRTWEVTIHANMKLKYLENLYVNFDLSCLSPQIHQLFLIWWLFLCCTLPTDPDDKTFPIYHQLHLNYLDWGLQIAWIMC